MFIQSRMELWRWIKREAAKTSKRRECIFILMRQAKCFT